MQHQFNSFSSTAHHDSRLCGRLADDSSQKAFDIGKQEPVYDPVQLAPVRLPSFTYRQPLQNYGYYQPQASFPSPGRHGGATMSGSNAAQQLGGPGASGQPLAPNRLAAAYSPQWAAFFDEEPRPPPPQPSSYIAWSIMSLLCSCMPLGIAALVFSSDVKSDYAAGRYADSERKSSLARLLNIMATILGVAMILTLGAVYGIYGAKRAF